MTGPLDKKILYPMFDCFKEAIRNFIGKYYQCECAHSTAEFSTPNAYWDFHGYQAGYGNREPPNVDYYFGETTLPLLMFNYKWSWHSNENLGQLEEASLTIRQVYASQIYSFLLLDPRIINPKDITVVMDYFANRLVFEIIRLSCSQTLLPLLINEICTVATHLVAA